MKLADDVADSQLQDRIDMQAPNKACTLIYTVSETFFIPTICL